VARPAHERFGKALQQAYKQAGLTQEDLAKRLQDRGVNVTQSRISSWARGMYRIPPEIYADIDAACDLPLGGFLELAGLVDAQALVDRKKGGNGGDHDPFSHLPGRRDVAAARRPRAG
jgi:transcriptional regulator with XRE-family HTH domain